MASILHRLTVRKDILSVLGNLLAECLLTLISDLGGEHRPVISKENGKMIVQAYKPEGMEPVAALALLSSKIQEACAMFGHGYTHLSSCLNGRNYLQVTFTNDLMTYQGTNVAGESGFGSRGNNKAVRNMLGVATFPELFQTLTQATQEAYDQEISREVESVATVTEPVASEPETLPDAEALAREVDARLAQADTPAPEPVVSRRQRRKGRK